MRLSTYLQQRHLSAAEFGRRAGLSKQAMSRYVRGVRVPCPEAMARIVKASKGRVKPGDFYVIDEAPVADGSPRRRAA